MSDFTFEETLPQKEGDLCKIYFDAALTGRVLLHCPSPEEAQTFRFQCYRKRQGMDIWKGVRIVRQGADLIFINLPSAGDPP